MPDPLHLLEHVLENECTDPDCEIHNIDVAIAEEVISPNDLAFWLAGAVAMWKAYDCFRPGHSYKKFFDLAEEGARRLV